MEVKYISRLIGSYIQRNGFRALLGARPSSLCGFCDKPTYYNRKGGKGGNYNKYYSNENAFTFDEVDKIRFNKERPGEYYSFESFLDPNDTTSDTILRLEAVDFATVKLPPVKRNLYQEPQIVKDRTTYEVECFRESNNMNLSGPNIPNPILKFSDYQYPEPLQKALDEYNFDEPMPIQSQTWPIALSGMDLIGIGQTGSGKTLGFLLPAILHASNQEVFEGAGPVSIILAPTRELVQQIAAVVDIIVKYMDMKWICLYGGVSKKTQIESLLKGPLICVATPGRLLDILQHKVVSLENCSYLVLDEADRMLDMGFEPQIRTIFSQVRPDRQTLMWSATWPDDIQSMANEFLIDPIHIKVGSSSLYANPNISQQIIMTDNIGKISVLKDLLDEEMKNPNAKVLIFVETKKTARTLNIRLQRKNIPTSDLHGDHCQMARNRVINAFRKGILTIIIATNVASRGIDVNDISLVINYTMPKDIETYVHRIGRTGRANKEGRSVSLFTNEDKKLAKSLVRLLQETSQTIPKALHTYCRSS